MYVRASGGVVVVVPANIREGIRRNDGDDERQDRWVFRNGGASAL